MFFITGLTHQIFYLGVPARRRSDCVRFVGANNYSPLQSLFDIVFRRAVGLSATMIHLPLPTTGGNGTSDWQRRLVMLSALSVMRKVNHFRFYP